MFYDANIGERCETERTWIRTTKRHYGLSRRNSELNEFTNYNLDVTTNKRLVVIKKFVNSINSLLPRLSETWPQSAQQRIKRIYEFSSLRKTNKELAVIKKFVNSINSLLPRLSEKLFFVVSTINNQSLRYTSNY